MSLNQSSPTPSGSTFEQLLRDPVIAQNLNMESPLNWSEKEIDDQKLIEAAQWRVRDAYSMLDFFVDISKEHY